MCVHQQIGLYSTTSQIVNFAFSDQSDWYGFTHRPVWLLCVHSSSTTNQTERSAPIHQWDCQEGKNMIYWIIMYALIKYNKSDSEVCTHRPIRSLCVRSSTSQIAVCAVIHQSDRYVCSHRPISSSCVQSSNTEIVKCAIVDLSDCEARTNQPVNLLSVHSLSSQIVEKATIDQSESKVCVHPPIRLWTVHYLGSHPPPHDYPHFLHHLQVLKWLLMILNKPLPTV